MSPEDQARYQPVLAIQAQPDSHPPPKTDKLERDEQRSFYNWILLQRSKGRRFPCTWHSTAHRTKGTLGTPDFIVGVNGQTIYLEFKRDYSSKLSPEQVQYREDCQIQALPHFIVYSAEEAIAKIEDYDRLYA